MFDFEFDGIFYFDAQFGTVLEIVDEVGGEERVGFDYSSGGFDGEGGVGLHFPVEGNVVLEVVFKFEGLSFLEFAVLFSDGELDFVS